MVNTRTLPAACAAPATGLVDALSPNVTWQSAIFNHEKNIKFGHARVIYAEAVESRPSGWVMPGGLRTTDYAEAFGWAVKLDDLLVACGWRGDSQ